MDATIWTGLANALSPLNLASCFTGCFLGTLVGVLPGLGPAATTTMLLPLTLYMPPGTGIIMLAGIFYGASYGGSTTAILLNVPGEVSSVPAAIEGYPMTKQGRAGEALFVAAVGSFIAGTLGVVALAFMGPSLASIAFRFGPPEYLGLIVLSLTSIVSFSGRSMLKGLTSGALGILFSCVGLDVTSGVQRLTFGVRYFLAGVHLVPVVMGLFGISEVFVSAEQKIKAVFAGKLGKMIVRGKKLKRALRAIFRGTGLGNYPNPSTMHLK